MNFGCRAGVFKLLQKDLNNLIGIHCSGHRLKVALKDAAKQICYINTLEKLLSPFIDFITSLQICGMAYNKQEKL